MIKQGMILAAGLGKRMQPATLKTPKPLLKIGNKYLLERAIDLLSNYGVEKLVINVHYLADQIINFIKRKNFNIEIIISDERDDLLDTGGGILKGTKIFGNNPFLVINPDTIWSLKYLQEIRNLESLYYEYGKSCLLIVNKSLSYDHSFKGDFNLNSNVISRDKINNFIFTGLQILNNNIFDEVRENKFSMNKIWDNLIKKKSLFGLESNQTFYHLNTNEILKKISNLKIID